MSIVVHQLKVSPPARAVLITAELIGLHVETSNLDLVNGDQHKPEYLAKNPLHTIPLIEDGDFILADSHAIMIYLISKYGAEKSSDLYPDDLKERAIVHQRLFVDASILFPRLSAMVKGFLYENELLLDEKKTAYVEEAYGFLEKYLETSSYIAGEHFTIADISCATTVSTLNMLISIGDKYPKLEAWLNKLSCEDWYINMNLPGLKDFRSLIEYGYRKNSMRKKIS